MSEREKKPELEVSQAPAGSSTLPPARFGQQSGRYRVRQLMERKNIPREKLREPTIGGILLGTFPEWSELLPKVKTAIESEVLNFIAKDEIPSDEQIIAEIERLSADDGRVQTLILVAQEFLGKYDTLPEDVVAQIQAWIINFIKENPQANEISVIRETLRMADLGIISINEYESIRPSALPAAPRERLSTIPDTPATRKPDKEK